MMAPAIPPTVAPIRIPLALSLPLAMSTPTSAPAAAPMAVPWAVRLQEKECNKIKESIKKAAVLRAWLENMSLICMVLFIWFIKKIPFKDEKTGQRIFIFQRLNKTITFYSCRKKSLRAIVA